MSQWYFRITHQEFVVWGYGPANGRPGTHIDVAVKKVHVRDLNETFTFPFELPKHDPNSTLAPPEIHDRITKWGWRFEFEEGFHNTGWKLADSREEALELARLLAEEHDAKPSSMSSFVEAMSRVREDQ